MTQKPKRKFALPNTDNGNGTPATPETKKFFEQQGSKLEDAKRGNKARSAFEAQEQTFVDNVDTTEGDSQENVKKSYLENPNLAKDVSVQQPTVISARDWYKQDNPFSEEVVNQWFIDGAINELGFAFEYGYTTFFNPETKKKEVKDYSSYSVKIGNGFTEAVFNFFALEKNFISKNINADFGQPVYGSQVKDADGKYKFKKDYNNMFSQNILRAVMLIADKIFVDQFEGKAVVVENKSILEEDPSLEDVDIPNRK